MDVRLCKRIIENVSRVIVEKQPSIELLLVALLADGHVLIDDIPGLKRGTFGKGGTFVLKQLKNIAVMQPPPLNWPPCSPLMS